MKRFVRTLAPTRRAAGVFHCAPGAEAQIDFFQGAPTLEPATRQWRRPWVFRMTLGHSRHGYEEAVWDQKLATFLRLHERAFRDLGGVALVIRHDNLKAAVVRACFYDPDSHEVYLGVRGALGLHAAADATPPPQENGKQERSGGYVKDNALKGRRFDSLAAQNAFLRQWNRTIARRRIHGTTRRQVWTHFLDTEQRPLQPLAATAFPILQGSDDRYPFVNKDGKLGFIDSTGREVIPAQFQPIADMSHFNEGLAPVNGPDGAGYIDPLGRFVIGPTREWGQPRPVQ